MITLADDMKKLLNETDIWVLATSDTFGMPNAVPIYYKKVLEDGRLMLVDNFLKKSYKNIMANPNVSISVWHEKTGYQFKGTACMETEGSVFETGKAMVKNRVPKGVVIVDVESVYTTTAGTEAGNRVL